MAEYVAAEAGLDALAEEVRNALPAKIADHVHPATLVLPRPGILKLLMLHVAHPREKRGEEDFLHAPLLFTGNLLDVVSRDIGRPLSLQAGAGNVVPLTFPSVPGSHGLHGGDVLAVHGLVTATDITMRRRCIEAELARVRALAPVRRRAGARCAAAGCPVPRAALPRRRAGGLA
jgi:hypothetical protein